MGRPGYPGSSTALGGFFPGFWHRLFILNNRESRDTKSTLSWDAVLGAAPSRHILRERRRCPKVAPLPSATPSQGRRRVFRARPPEGMGRDGKGASGAREWFPCTAAASAGPGAAEQQREWGRAWRESSELQGWNRSRGGSRTEPGLSRRVYKSIDPLSAGRGFFPSLSRVHSLTAPSSHGHSRAAAPKSSPPIPHPGIPGLCQQSWSPWVLPIHPKTKSRGGRTDPIPQPPAASVAKRNFHTKPPNKTPTFGDQNPFPKALG